MTDTRTARSGALAAGAGILAMAVLAGVVGAAGPTGLLTGSDAGATLRDSLASPGNYRLSVTALVLVAVLDLVVAWGLFEFFTPVNPALARLVAWSRMTYAAVFLVAIGQLVGVPTLRGLTEYNDLWQMALVLFGFHLVLLGTLCFTSGLVPRWIAVLAAVSGIGYLLDSFGYLLSPEYDAGIASFTFIGELLLGLWLVMRAAKRAPGVAGLSEPAPAPTPV